MTGCSANLLMLLTSKEANAAKQGQFELCEREKKEDVFSIFHKLEECCICFFKGVVNTGGENELSGCC